jgi:hypothetical protein
VAGAEELLPERVVEKIWLKSYPPGVPAEIDPGAYRSLKEVFERSNVPASGRAIGSR